MSREYARFRWSHQSVLHRKLVKVYNFLMGMVPFSIKYSIGMQLRKRNPPYSLIDKCSVVVQVGAPSDTLVAGRSRGMYFSLLASPECRVVIIEPDPSSVRCFQSILKSRNLHNTIVCPMGAWSEKKTLKLYVNNTHPASNFVEGAVQYDAKRLQAYNVVEIPVDTIDHILADCGIEKVDLISINTNGSEREILKGMNRTLASGVSFVALARTGAGYMEMMQEYGYQFFAHDDRGYTFEQSI